MPPLGDENVRWLDVAIDNACGVSGIEGVSDFIGEQEKDFRFKRTPCKALIERNAIQKLHCDERLPVLLANIVNGADVRMVQGRGSLSLAPEAAQCLGIFSYNIR